MNATNNNARTESKNTDSIICDDRGNMNNARSGWPAGFYIAERQNTLSPDLHKPTNPPFDRTKGIHMLTLVQS